MNLEILIVTSEPRTGMALDKELRRKLRDRDPRVQVAYDQKEAKELISERKRNLIIVSADLAANEHTPIIPGEDLGVDLVSWAEHQDSNLVSIIFAEVISETRSAKIDTLKRTKSQSGGLKLFEDIANIAASLLSGRIGSTAKFLNLTIRATTSANNWTYELSGEGFEFRRGPGDLRLDDRVIARLKERSREIDRMRENFRNQLKFLGEEILREVFKSDVDFWGNLQEGLGRLRALDTESEGVGRLKICFQIVRTVHPVFWESLYSPDAKREFWMLDAPISRMLTEYPSSCQKPLFSCTGGADGDPINCLIVAADTFGNTKFFDSETHQRVRLSPLPNVKAESDVVQTALQESRSKYNIEQIVAVADLVASQSSYRETLIEVLRSDVRWDIVHYIGHSLYDAETGKGYIFIPPEQEGNPPEPLEISEFAARLKGTRFLFLSGCQSSGIDFLDSLARCNVPAAIGFRRDVVDDQAKEYSDRFYKHLLDSRASQRHPGCLQHAFLEARTDMFAKYPNDWIWANPVLLMQSK